MTTALNLDERDFGNYCALLNDVLVDEIRGESSLAKDSLPLMLLQAISLHNLFVVSLCVEIVFELTLDLHFLIRRVIFRNCS